MYAMIFDLDGVLVSTNIMHRDALALSLRINQGIDVRNYVEISERSMVSSLEKIRKIQRIFKFPESQIPEILATKDRIFQEKIKNIKVLPNTIAVLEYVRDNGILTAIASNSRSMNIYKILELTNLRKYFNTVISSDDVENRKPAPDMLYEIYRRLNVDGKNTLFIDDTDEGCAAGYNSLSTVIKINSPEDLTIDLVKPWVTECTLVKI